jgi:hypothetical protein
MVLVHRHPLVPGQPARSQSAATSGGNEGINWRLYRMVPVESDLTDPRLSTKSSAGRRVGDELTIKVHML